MLSCRRDPVSSSLNVRRAGVSCSMTAAQLLDGEKEIESAFETLHAELGARHDLVTDGVIDAERYASSSPRMLWILREPWEDLAPDEAGGGWSVTKDVFSQPITSNRGALPVMAYIAYSVFNGFPLFEGMDYATKNPAIAEALKSVASINIKKTPGKTSSYLPEIAAHFQQNRALLVRQVKLLAPRVIIAGGTLRHFYSEFGLSDSAFNKERSAWFCEQGGVLYIHANHPAQRRAKGRYIDDIVSIIKEFT